MMRDRFALAVGSCLALVVGLAPPARALIDLEWRPESQTVLVGTVVEIGLYAVSDDETEQSIAAMDVILDWDPGTLELIGVINNGPYAWLFSGFTDDSGLDGLNDTWLDGDALYSAFGQLGNPAFATADGLLVTTVQFMALAESPATEITVPAEFGQFTRSRVFDGETPGLEVQGTLGSASATIVGTFPGDCDGDGDVDLDDHADFEACLLGPLGGLAEGCDCFDFDASGHVDLRDFAAFQGFYTG